MILWIRLLLLSVVWTLTTTLLPLYKSPIVSSTILLFIIRLLFLWNISLLFLIRDEAKHFKSGVPQLVLATTLVCQGLVSILYFNTDEIYSIFFIVMTLLVVLVCWFTLQKKRSEYYYLGVVDGLMLVEALLLFLLTIKFVD